METSIIPQEIVSVKLQVGYAIVTTLHPTKSRRIWGKKIQSLLIICNIKVIVVLKKKKSPILEKFKPSHSSLLRPCYIKLFS